MNLLNKLTIKSLNMNRKRTIVTIIGIVLSTALIVAVASIFISMHASMIEYEKKENGDYHYMYRNVSEEDLKYFANNRGIESYYTTKEIGYAKVDSKNEAKPYVDIFAYDDKALDAKKMNLVEGRLPENSEEILITTHLKNNGRLSLLVGDKVTLDIGKRYVKDSDDTLNQYNPYTYEEEEFRAEETKVYKIVGIIERPAGVEEPFTAPGYTMITRMDKNETSGNYNLFLRLNKDGIKNKAEINADLLGIEKKTFEIFYSTNLVSYTEEDFKIAADDLENSRYELSVNGYLVILESSLLEDSTMQSLFVLVIIVVLIIIVTSVFCIKNSFDISITEKTRQYGMLRSIGATKKQIKKNVYFEALVLSFIGIPLGVLAGLGASVVLIFITNYLLKEALNLKLMFDFSLLAIGVSIVLALITIYLSAMRSARKASKISPIDAIRSSHDIKIKNKKYIMSGGIKKLFGIGGDIAYKNLKRNSKKYRTTVISIIVCVSMFIALSTFIELAFRTTKMMAGSTNYNISYTYSSGEEPFATLASDKKDRILSISKLDTIIDYSVLKSEQFYINNLDYTSSFIKYLEDHSYSLDDKMASVYAIGEEPYLKFIEKLGLNYDEVKDKAIVINKSNIQYYDTDKKKQIREEAQIYEGIKSGIKLALNNFDYDDEGVLIDNGKHIEIEVALVTDSLPVGLGIDGISSPFVIVSNEWYDKNVIIRDTDREFYNIDIYSSDPDRLQDEIEKLMGQDISYSLYNVEEEKKTMDSLFTLIAIFLYGFITVIALIGITNIFNTITTSMSLRSREFAIMKCVGMTDREFDRMILLESLLYGLKSLIIGIPLGIGLSVLIHKSLVNGIFVIDYVLPYKAIIGSILAVFVLITIIMKYSISRISKQNIIETIRNENI